MARRFTLTAPVVRETPIHIAVADAFRLEIAPAGRLSAQGVVWWSVDMAAYAGNAPGIRTRRGCISGVPDIVVIYRGRAHFIELKALDGIVSDSQRNVAVASIGAEALWGAARDVDEALGLLDAWSIPRAHRINLGRGQRVIPQQAGTGSVAHKPGYARHSVSVPRP